MSEATAQIIPLPVNDPTGIEQAAARIADLERQVHGLTYKLRDAEDLAAGHESTIRKQSREIGTLSRKLQEEEDPNSHPKGAEIVALIERWKRGTGHANSKTSADRVKLVKSRLKDGYSPEQIELAVDGIAAYPFVVNGTRTRTGRDSERHDRLGIPLGGGESVEKFAVLGYQARKAGIVDWGETA